jgi:hypothetical protein
VGPTYFFRRGYIRPCTWRDTRCYAALITEERNGAMLNAAQKCRVFAAIRVVSAFKCVVSSLRPGFTALFTPHRDRSGTHEQVAVVCNRFPSLSSMLEPSISKYFRKGALNICPSFSLVLDTTGFVPPPNKKRNKQSRKAAHPTWSRGYNPSSSKPWEAS